MKQGQVHFKAINLGLDELCHPAGRGVLCELLHQAVHETLKSPKQCLKTHLFPGEGIDDLLKVSKGSFEGLMPFVQLGLSSGDVALLPTRACKFERMVRDLRDFESLVKVMGSHFNPTRNILVKRKLFSSRRKEIDEFNKDYIATLRKQAQKCKFGSTLEERLRDQ
ncbi:K02A2.6-like [Cordylochernes scorpioides]|uniref:K02A2.6-like n=1 Tax=Cordylochernes scorpioides TaxID=51811 RepID=A0ABY6LJQ7_9ARAC|nr:K02A2.6-like [Cordylochernes scorpioides]